MHPLSVSIITVLYNSNHVLPAMLASVPESVDIILVDNGTEPPDLSQLARSVRYIKNPENLGFGRACNIGARAAKGELLFFLNPDAVLRPGFIDAVQTALRAHPNCGTFSATTFQNGKLYALNMTSIESALTATPRRKASAEDVTTDMPVRFANGGALIIKATLFAKIGGFDENIFLYNEDDDLSYRLLLAGEPIIQIKDAIVDHVLGTSTAPSLALARLRGYGKEKSTRYLARKYQLPERHGLIIARILVNIALYTLLGKTHRRAAQLGRLKARTEAI